MGERYEITVDTSRAKEFLKKIEHRHKLYWSNTLLGKLYRLTVKIQVFFYRLTGRI